LNCQPQHAQKWSLEPYRTTWQARLGYSIYRKGPDVVSGLEVTQTPGCDVIGKESDGTVKLMGTIKGQQVQVKGKRLNMHAPLGEEGFLDVEGTVNTKETMLSWNTVPPTYWVKESVLEGRPTLKNTVKRQVKDAIARERNIKSAERTKKIGELDTKAIKNAKTKEGKTKAIKKEKREKAKTVKQDKSYITGAAARAKTSCENVHGDCTDQLCGPFKGKGYAKKAGSDCTRATKSDCAAVCGFGMVYPIEYVSPIGQAMLHKLEPKKYPNKFKAAHYGKTFFATHGWPKANIHRYGWVAEKAPCADTRRPFYFWTHVIQAYVASGVSPASSPTALCAWIKSPGPRMCLDTTPHSWLDGYSWRKFATLFCRKTCNLPEDGRCNPNRKSIRATDAEHKKKEHKRKRAAEQARKMLRKYKKFVTCTNQYGLKGAGTAKWIQDNTGVNRRLLGSGHQYYSPTYSDTLGPVVQDGNNFAGGGCYDVNGVFLGHGPCVALDGSAASKQVTIPTTYGEWTDGEAGVCQPYCSGTYAYYGNVKCAAFNSLLSYRRRHGVVVCQQYASSSSVCPDYSKCNQECQATYRL